MSVDFSGGAVLVIGDCMLDRYFSGSVSRISPEAPVPVVRVTKSWDTLGGAGNVANNCAHLGTPVTVIGTLGADENGRIFRRLCIRNRIRLVALAASGPTITKTRIIGERQQIVRIDFEEVAAERLPAGGLRPAAEERRVIAENLNKASAVVLSDYGKGFCSSGLCLFVIKEARARKVPVIVDPKGTRWHKYRGAAVVTPNVKELSDIAGKSLANNDAVLAARARLVRSRFALGSVLVTRSEKGMTLVGKSFVEHFPTTAREVFDVSGAGDTVVAALAAGLAAGYPIAEAVTMANRAAGIVVGKIGTVPIEIGELRAELDKNHNAKQLAAADLIRRCAMERQRGRTIVFANGCFDILHRGHIHLLREAKKLGDCLVVALNSDRSMQGIAGRTKPPINGETDRAHLIAAIDGVDFITLFDEKTPLPLIRRLRPDVIVKGGNYRLNEILGREYARKAVIIPQLPGYSGDTIVGKITGR